MEPGTKPQQKEEPPKAIELMILDYIRDTLPEYAAQCTSVTRGFIKLIYEASWRVVFPDAPAEEVSALNAGMTDEDAEKVFLTLSPEVISRPLTFESIHIINEETNHLMRRQFEEETASMDCVYFWEFMNRANARASLGRHLEALEDYNRACDLGPENPDCLYNRAIFLAKAGATQDALRDATRARHLMGEGRPEEFYDFYFLSKLFLRCGQLDLALETIRISTAHLGSIAPFLKRDHDGNLRVDMIANRVHQSGYVDVDGILRLAEEILHSVDGEDPALNGAREAVNRNILFVKSVVDSL